MINKHRLELGKYYESHLLKIHIIYFSSEYITKRINNPVQLGIKSTLSSMSLYQLLACR